MLNEKIRNLREELNDNISKGENFEKIYELSLKLDDLIAQYYKNKK